MVLKSQRGGVRIGVNLENTIQYTYIDQVFREGDFDFQCIPSSFYEDLGEGPTATSFEPFTYSDYVYPSQKWKHHIVQKLSRSLIKKLAIEDTDAQHVIDQLRQEVDWAAHCGANALLVPLDSVNLETAPLQHLCALLKPQLSKEYGPRILVELPLVDEQGSSGVNTLNKLHALLGYDVACVVRCKAIEVVSHTVLDEWFACAPECVALCQSLFETHHVKNKDGVKLPDVFEKFVLRLFESGAQCILVTDETKKKASHFCFGAKSYLHHLWKSLPILAENEVIRLDYKDLLQIPLQPLKDNLEAETYEAFEADGIKYDVYEQAFRVIISQKVVESETKRLAGQDVCLTVAYCGGGRGPLMARFFSAMRSLKLVQPSDPAILVATRTTDGEECQTTVPHLSFRFYIVEKNTNAAATLRYRIQHDPDILWRHVQLFNEDMRYWAPDHEIDILISELLGSFGDNELSPECLDSVQKHLSSTGVSIPKQYTSFLEPIMALKPWKSAALDVKNLESHFVADLFSFIPLSQERNKPAFTFRHPNPDIRDAADDVLRRNRHNERFATLEWEVDQAGILHGFAGYFRAVLCDGVICSICPDDHTPTMDSWFPIFIPLSEPTPVRRGDHIKLMLWRRCRNNKVWYEWSLGAPILGVIHNAGGEKMAISM